MGTTEAYGNQRHLPFRMLRSFGTVAACCLAGVVALALAGCSAGAPAASTGSGSMVASAPVGHNMAGPAQDVVVSRAALDAKPAPWVLTTPESAVRSYLDWISYGYRIGDSDVTTPTMSTSQEVHIDSYIQLNLESGRLIDQTLTSITFGASSVDGTHTLLPAKEKWTYRYVSIKDVGKTLAGPYTASYDTTYTLVKSGKGWVVDSVAAQAVGQVK